MRRCIRFLSTVCAIITAVWTLSGSALCQPPLNPQGRPQPPGPPPVVIPATPQGVLDAFMQAFRASDEVTLAALVTERSLGPVDLPWQKLTEAIYGQQLLSVEGRVAERANAFVRLLRDAPVVLTAPQGATAEITVDATKQIKETIVLIQEKGQWKVDLWRTLGLNEDAVRRAQGIEPCTNNLKQLALGLRMFCADHDGRLPDAGKWCDAIWPYVKDANFFACPKQFPTAHRSPLADYSYVMNARISGVSIDDMDAPTQVVLLYEALVPGKNTADAGESVVPGGRHEGAVGVAFCDGHVQMVSIEQFRRLRFDPRPPR